MNEAMETMTKAHEHISIEDLRCYNEIMANDKPTSDELDRFFGIEDKIMTCRACHEKYLFAKDVEALLGEPIWILHDLGEELKKSSI